MAVDPCLEVVRAGDKDMFLSLLFAPEAAQPHLFALHAFAVEVQRISRIVSEPQIGEIRLQWWADVLVALSDGKPQDHPVAFSLARTVTTHNLPMAPLLAFIEAHRHDLYEDKLSSLNDVEGYCGETRSILFQLTCLILDRESAPAAALASGLAGVAFELARAMTTASAEKLIPADMAKSDILQLADRRYTEAREAYENLPHTLKPAFLPVSLVPLYLNAARQNRTIVPQWKRQWHLWSAARRGIN
jgi:15-cis-phytoene synthase